MKRTVALKRNCCSLPDSKAQSSPGAEGTSRASPALEPRGAQGLRGSCGPSREQRGRSEPSGMQPQQGQLCEGDCLILRRPNTREKHGCWLWLERLTPRTRWAAAAARAAPARSCRAPAGWTAATAGRCWTATSTVRFPVQVKSFFQLILLFVPSGLPLLPSLRTSNGFSLDPAKNKHSVTPRQRTASFTPALQLLLSLQEQSTHHQKSANKSALEHKPPTLL